MELARLSNGQIIGLDIDQPLLYKLRCKLKKTGFSDQVKAVKCSMFEISFKHESFDIIWAEGSIFRIGFERGLKEWHRFLKSNGFMVVHDEIGNLTKKQKQISDCGYVLLGHLILTEDVWWIEYYSPMEKQIKEFRSKYFDNPKIIKVLDKEQQEIDMFKKNPKLYASEFFIIQKL
ncbi:MAG: class I SAM-dependent methyltransferase [Desulfobacterales bacterium]|nr:MAG: class I SAM-dependent methyltransferase [Desulfobacterales bacterium]